LEHIEDEDIHVTEADKNKWDTASAGGIEEAPDDGLMYGRKDKAWEEITNTGNGDGGTFTNSAPTPTTVAGIAAGSTFNNVSHNTMWNNLLYPYQIPTFSAFSISGQATTLEVGATVPENRVFTWTVTNVANIQPDSLTIRNQTANTDIETGLAVTASPFTSDSPSVQRTSAGNNVWRIAGINTQSASFNRDFTVSWNWRRWWGESPLETLNETAIKSLRVSELNNSSGGTFAFNGGGYKYIVGMTQLTTFRNQANNLPVPFEAGYQVAITNANGISQTVWVYRTTFELGGSITVIAS
jgi:hypothetical protein